LFYTPPKSSSFHYSLTNKFPRNYFLQGYFFRSARSLIFYSELNSPLRLIVIFPLKIFLKSQTINLSSNQFFYFVYFPNIIFRLAIIPLSSVLNFLLWIKFPVTSDRYISLKIFIKSLSKNLSPNHFFDFAYFPDFTSRKFSFSINYWVSIYLDND